MKLIVVSLSSDSKQNKTIRSGLVKLLEKKMREVTFIDAEEIPLLMKQIEKISPQEPQVAEEVKQLIQKFHPNLL